MGYLDKMPIERDPNKDYFESFKRLCEDWADDDDLIRDTAKLVLQDNYVEGNSYGVPGHPTIIAFLVAYIMVLRGQEPPEGEEWRDLRWEYNRIKNNPKDCVK
jgi:hypothetical protein